MTDQQDRAETQRQIRELLDSERSVFFQRQRSAIDPLQAERKGWYDHAVGYGQMSLRSLFILNGSALIAVPAFAEMLGDGLWARGAWHGRSMAFSPSRSASFYVQRPLFALSSP